MCATEELFVDRRPHAAPSDSDFIEPLTPKSVAAANDRIRRAAKPWDQADVDAAIRGEAVKRHRARRTGRGDFASVGEYLAHFQG